ncbi:hypothetical protein, partial [Marinimicrobium locisalis]|uniref:hypothetical protein n=1 Tax=Marinimicrobium locisalis TaxID=546022 RepID=UPI003221BEC9
IETLIGGGQTDTFEVSDGTTYSGVIDGAGGANDEVDFTGVTSAVTVRFGGGGSDWDLSRINVITGNDQTTLGLASGTNTWTLDGSASGEVVTIPPTGEDALFQGTLTFTGVSALHGGSGEDTFEATGNTVFAGLLKGGAGSTNTLDLSGFTDPATLVLGGDTGGWNFTEIQDFVGNNDATLGISHGTNTWTLNQAQGGTLSHNP